MKKKNISKKVLAILLSFVMLATSIPFMLVGSAAGGQYDPAPIFSEAAIEKGARAWLDDEGNIHVTFPDAIVGPTYAEYKAENADGTISDAEIAARTKTLYYIVELVDMGNKESSHNEVLMTTIKVDDDTTSDTQTGTFLASKIGAIDLNAKRYNATITAVDSEGWFSQPIYTTVTNVPVAEIEDNFVNFSTSSTAVREMTTFDKEGNGDTATMVSGNALLYMGIAEEAGTEDLSDNIGDTLALRFIMNTLPSGNQTFDTTVSRETWDFSQAEEVWFWMDLTDVELTGVSFRLRANEKVWYDWGKDNSMTVTQKNYMGDIIYSTKGYTGTDGYVFVQNEDGSWTKKTLTNGTVDLADFKGYVRVPIEFICSENASYAQLKNTGFNNGSTDFATGFVSNNLNNGDSHANGIPITKTLVDAAGTNIKDARLMQHRIVATKTGLGGSGNENYWHFTNGQWTRNTIEEITRGEDAMIAAGLSEAEAVNDVDEGYKAIDDLYSVGFAFTGSTEASLQNSFFVDNVFFYDEDGAAWPTQSLDGVEGNTGSSMSQYYNEEYEIAERIFDAVDQYIAEPDWADYRELEYVLDMVQAYVDAFTAAGKSTAFLGLTRDDPDNGVYASDGLAYVARQLDRAESWENAWLAYEACVTAETMNADITIKKANADKDDLVHLIVRKMEKLPAPADITSVSDALRAEIIQIWKTYSLLNLGQLEMLGADEEQKILDYIALLDGMVADDSEFIVGQQLADYPFIVFNDFEKNYTVGDEGWKLEDNKDAYSTGYTSSDGKVAGTHDASTQTLANDWRHLKNLVTYTINGSENISGRKIYGYSPTDTDYADEVMDGKLNYDAAWATITNNGYLNSQAATVYVDSSFTTSSADNPHEGVYHSVTVTRHGKNASTWAEMEANNTGLDGLDQFGQNNWVSGSSSYISLIFYVDFSEISNFHFNINIFTKRSGTYAKAGIEMGNNLTTSEDTKASDWNYWILDPTTGEWVENNTDSPYSFTSAKLSAAPYNNTLGLDNYRGYIKIPLYHFKFVLDGISDVGGNTSKLDYDDNQALGSIHAIQFSVAGASPESLDEKTFTIDNVGFTYEPGSYNTTTKHSSYAEIFGAKSLPASQFEEAVEAIDPFDESTIAANVASAQALYDALPAYQQTVVADAKAVLDTYAAYAADTTTIPQPAYSTTDFNNLIAAIPQAAKDAQISGKSADGTIDYDIIHPGYTNGAINYSTYGFDPAKVSETENLDDPTNPYTIIKYYTETYARYTAAEKAAVDKTSLLNAYNAAMRTTKTLNDIKTGTYSFLGSITNLYNCQTKDFVADDETTTDIDEQVGYNTFLEISESKRKEVLSFWNNVYGKMPYYSKTSIDDGSIYPQLTNSSRGLNYYLKNTDSFSVDGTTINGGLVKFKEKMTNMKTEVLRKINADERFSADELQAIKDLLEEYNALLPAYYNVTDLYNLEYDILNAFADATIDVFDAATDGSSITQVVLNNGGTTSDEAYVDLTYIAALLDKTVTLEISSDLVLQQISGTTYSAFNSFTVEGLTANTPVTYTYDNLYPDETFTRIPLNIAVDATTAAKVPQDAVYEGVINIKVYDTDDINAGLTGDDLVPIAELPFTVQFQSTNGTVPVVYVVEIPADMAVDWDQTTAEDVSYTVKNATLNKGTLTVGVADNTGNFDTATGTGKLVNGDNSIVYTANNFDDVTFDTDITADTKPTPAPEVLIAQDDWDAAAVGRYETTLTYTVVYDDGTT